MSKVEALDPQTTAHAPEGIRGHAESRVRMRRERKPEPHCSRPVLVLEWLIGHVEAHISVAC